MQLRNLVLLFFTFTTALHFFCSSAEELAWTKKTLEQMTLNEKIGQLFMVAGHLDPEFCLKETGNENYKEMMEKYIREYHIGGIAYVGPSEVERQVNHTNYYQRISKYPLLFAQDLEWGLAMRISDGMSFPKNITLGDIQNNQMIYELGKEIGRQAKLIGIHMNLSPVLDVNMESENIAINIRSFGASATNVAEKGVAMLTGLQDAGIIASAKHFPGLGDIQIDPYLGLPLVSHNKKRLFQVELYPFIKAIEAGVLSIQTEHVLMPALDSDPKSPASLSKKIVNQLLKKELGFTGLVLSGALRMKALTDYQSDKEIILKAFHAGNDMLLMPKNLPQAHQTIKDAVEEGNILEEEIDEKVLKILSLKEKCKLHRDKIISQPTKESLNTPHARELKRQLYKSVVNLMRDTNQLVPIPTDLQGPCAYVQIGDAPFTTFFDRLLTKNCVFEPYFFPYDANPTKELQRLMEKQANYQLIFLAIYPADPRRIEKIRLLAGKQLESKIQSFRVHGLSVNSIELLKRLESINKKVIVVYFGAPFGLPFLKNFSTLLMAYENDPHAQNAAFDLLSTHLQR